MKIFNSPGGADPILMILLLGGLGILSRYYLDHWIFQWMGSLRSTPSTLSTSSPLSSFPWGIFVINVLGSFVASIVYSLTYQRGLISSDWSQALLVGFCGGLTTFSTFSLQTLQMLMEGQFGIGLLYMFGSPLLGVGAASLGLWLVR